MFFFLFFFEGGLFPCQILSRHIEIRYKQNGDREKDKNEEGEGEGEREREREREREKQGEKSEVKLCWHVNKYGIVFDK